MDRKMNEHTSSRGFLIKDGATGERQTEGAKSLFSPAVKLSLCFTNFFTSFLLLSFSLVYSNIKKVKNLYM